MILLVMINVILFTKGMLSKNIIYTEKDLEKQINYHYAMEQNVRSNILFQLDH
jgi:hypothetical protein